VTSPPSTSSDRPPTTPRADSVALLGDSEQRTISGLLAWLTRVSLTGQAHSRARRWIVPLVCAVPGIPSLLHAADGASPGLGVTLALAVGVCVPLLWRDRRPVPVFWTVAGLSAVGIALGTPAGAMVTCRMVALYHLARLGTPRQLGAALAVSVPEAVVTGLVLAEHGWTANVTQITATVVLLVVCTLAIPGLGLASRMARSHIAALEERAARLEIERDQRARLAVATERARVAREMHDILGHTLAVIVGLADGAAGLAENAPKRGADTLRIIADSGRGALGELRRLLAVVGDQASDPEAPLAPQPSLVDLDALVDRVRAAGPTVALHEEGDLTGLSQGLQLAVYRIVQEALTNTLKHAAPDTSVTVVVTAGQAAVRVTVQDAGPSRVPEPSQQREGGGRGLVGMRERAALYQGDVTAGPNAYGGWTVRARLTAPQRRTPNPVAGPTSESSPT
jgi:signal transduction histidine kinase